MGSSLRHVRSLTWDLHCVTRDLSFWHTDSLVVVLQISSCELRAIWDLSSLTRDRTHIPLTVRWSLNRWNTREVPSSYFYFWWNPIGQLKTSFITKIHISSVQLLVVSDSLWPHEWQHTRPPCPSPTPRANPNSCPLSQWCHPTISSSVIPSSSCLESFPASGSFQMSQLFASGGQSIGVSASASVLSVNTQDWSPLGWTVWISL